MSKRASALALTGTAFLGFGIVTAGIGPLLPDLARNNGVGLSEVGMIFTALFLGAVLSQFAAGPLSDRVGREPMLFYGLLLMGAAIAAFSLARSFDVTIGCAFLAGIGLGTAELGANVLIAELFAERGVSAVNLLNVFYGAGAFCGPALVSLSWTSWHTGVPVLWAGAVVIVIPAPFMTGRRYEIASPNARPPAGRGPGGAVYRSSLMWLLGAALLVYVGSEQAVGGWATVYMQRTAGLPLSDAALVASGYWIAYTVGRLAGAGLGVRMRPGAVLSAALCVALLGVALVNLTPGSERLSVIAILITGLGFGPVYPTAITIVSRAFPASAGGAVGAAGALGSAGGSLVPWAVGFVIARFGAVSGARCILATVLALIALCTLAQLSRARRRSVEAGVRE